MVRVRAESPRPRGEEKRCSGERENGKCTGGRSVLMVTAEGVLRLETERVRDFSSFVSSIFEIKKTPPRKKIKTENYVNVGF